MLPSQFKRLMEVLRSLAEAAHQANDAAKKQEAAIRDASKTANEQQREIPGVISASIRAAHEDVPIFEKAQRDKEYTQQGKILTATRLTAIATFLAFLAAGIYAYFAKRQLDEMIETTQQAKRTADASISAAKSTQQQAILTQQQLEGTMAATFRIHMEASSYTNRIDLGLMNIGHVIARRIHVDLKVLLRTPTGEQVRELIPIEYTVPEIGLTQDMWNQKSYPLRLSDAEVGAIRETKYIIRLEGTIGYYNGFNEVIDPICFVSWAWQTKNRAGNISTGENPQVPCDEFSAQYVGFLQNQQKSLKKK